MGLLLHVFWCNHRNQHVVNFDNLLLLNPFPSGFI